MESYWLHDSPAHAWPTRAMYSGPDEFAQRIFTAVLRSSATAESGFHETPDHETDYRPVSDVSARVSLTVKS